jgi:hypothetical protein
MPKTYPEVQLVPISTPRWAPLRISTLVLATLTMSCADAATSPLPMKSGSALTARATSEVIEMLTDAKSRVADALDDSTARGEITTTLDLMIIGIDLGRFEVVRRNSADIRAALNRAASADVKGAGDADRGAIELALDAVDEIIAEATKPSGI